MGKTIEIVAMSNEKTSLQLLFPINHNYANKQYFDFTEVTFKFLPQHIIIYQRGRQRLIQAIGQQAPYTWEQPRMRRFCKIVVGDFPGEQ